jgi:hypothetical protein
MSGESTGTRQAVVAVRKHRRQKAVPAAVAMAGCLLAGQGRAAADTGVTQLLGHATGAVNSTDCAPGSYLIGARIWVESRNYTTAVQAVCRDADGYRSDAEVAGSPRNGNIIDSTCANGWAAGLYGRVGDVIDAVGLRCTANPVTAALAGGGGGDIVGPADCPAGTALSGLTVYSAGYFGATDLYGIGGSCSALYNYSGIEAPIRPDGSSVFRTGSTVPVRFAVTDSAGDPEPGLSANLSYAPVTGNVTGTWTPATAPRTDDGNTFRYDAVAGQYIYHWSTEGIRVSRYRLRITTSYGAAYTADLTLR